MIHSSLPGCPLKQVEMNFIAASFGGISERLVKVHQMRMNQLLHTNAPQVCFLYFKCSVPVGFPMGLFDVFSMFPSFLTASFFALSIPLSMSWCIVNRPLIRYQCYGHLWISAIFVSAKFEIRLFDAAPDSRWEHAVGGFLLVSVFFALISVCIINFGFGRKMIKCMELTLKICQLLHFSWGSIFQNLFIGMPIIASSTSVTIRTFYS